MKLLAIAPLPRTAATLPSSSTEGEKREAKEHPSKSNNKSLSSSSCDHSSETHLPKATVQ
ncbi:hypothetical protein HPP92_010684 [Vanilla planifolia]|uniref:Uncharacterized protein n=1 Tax=Vanilla planifolia TaxID=51239 RepID=A0A835QZI0_VANPL|nr:hypothetical protein HPP92_010945 [Vanilla planifolia]KAG0482600.1 hypothetical protein HPP92_010684 [Vanilla planifolia]